MAPRKKTAKKTAEAKSAREEAETVPRTDPTPMTAPASIPEVPTEVPTGTSNASDNTAARALNKTSAPYKRFSYIKRAVVIIALVAVVVGIMFGILRLINGYWPFASLETRQAVEVERAVAAVGAHILLPEGETPLVATITDAATLREEQPFYQNAEDGDQLLIYGQSLRAILWSPSRDIIINVGPVELPTEQTVQNNAPAVSSAPRDGVSEAPAFPPDPSLATPAAETGATIPEESAADEPRAQTEPAS